jgi:multicomponent K+:H+ antiporter subunit E
MIRRLLPHPYLSALLAIIWMMLVNRFAWGSLVFAIILGIAIPALTEPYWPQRARLRNPVKIVQYILLVIWDIIMANIQVAKIVLFLPNRQLQPAWITIPLELRSPEAISVLAGTITLTPGTVSADLSQDGNALLVHCLHAPDPESVVADIKSRYEDRLKEIFE